MQAKKIGYFLSTLLLFSGLIYSVGASTTTVSFRGGGVTIDLTFPEEAHPDDNIWHNATLTANTALTLHNLTLVIKAPVDSTWQDVTGWYLFNRVLQENESRMEEMNFQLPSNANGTLQCFIYINTNQSTDYLSTTFYTTRVSNLTFSEMQSLYYEMLANYTTLQADYETLLNEYNDLLANYTNLFDNYTALLSEHNDLLAKYNAQVATYQTLLANYNKLSGDYNTLDSNYRSKLDEYSALQSDYDLLNSTHNSLQTSYDTLQAVYDALNQTYTDLLSDLNNLQERISDSESNLNTDRIVMFIFVVTVACLIAFIVYLKRKKEEPYVVIRKETVAVKSDEKS
jgi:predicted nuclease with TOPRIM domain